MKINVYLFGSPMFITIELPDGANFLGWCKNVKADGGIFSEQCHIPYDKILGMGNMDALAKFQTVPPQANAPTSETKQ